MASILASDMTAMHPSDEAGEVDVRLVAAFRQGDARAFESLVRRHQRPVWAVAMRFAKDADEAEDLAQRAFVKALENIDGLRGAFRPWLMRIAVNLAKNHVRDHAKFIDAAPPDEGHAPRTDDALAQEERRRRVRSALAQLGERQREVVMLRVDAQLSFQEIAQALEITENNAKVAYHHAVKRLRALCAGEE